ncbi:MAG: hypothetical protein ACOZAG_02890 [Patescibacteria group bacterium]
MREALKTACPQCGQEVKCFSPGGTADGLFLKVEYVAVCCNCGWREKNLQHAGWRIKARDILRETTCPFCGKSQNEHRKGLSLKETLPLMRIVSSQTTREQEIVPTRDEPKPSHVAACTLLPPKRRRTMFEKTFGRMTIKQILAFFSVLFTVIVGMCMFIANMLEGTGFTTAIFYGLAASGVIGIAMIVISALIFWSYRRRYHRNA